MCQDKCTITLLWSSMQCLTPVHSCYGIVTVHPICYYEDPLFDPRMVWALAVVRRLSCFKRHEAARGFFLLKKTLFSTFLPLPRW
jgi:hypothetical protein